MDMMSPHDLPVLAAQVGTNAEPVCSCCPILDLTPASTQYTDPEVDAAIANIVLPIMAPTEAAPTSQASSGYPPTTMELAVNPALPLELAVILAIPQASAADAAPAWFMAANSAVHTTLQAILARLDKQDDRLYSLEWPQVALTKRPSPSIMHPRPMPIRPDLDVALRLPTLAKAFNQIDDVDNVNVAASWDNDRMDDTDAYDEEAMWDHFDLPPDFNSNMDELLPAAHDFV